PAQSGSKHTTRQVAPRPSRTDARARFRRRGEGMGGSMHQPLPGCERGHRRKIPLGSVAAAIALILGGCVGTIGDGGGGGPGRLGGGGGGGGGAPRGGGGKH